MSILLLVQCHADSVLGVIVVFCSSYFVYRMVPQPLTDGRVCKYCLCNDTSTETVETIKKYFNEHKSYKVILLYLKHDHGIRVRYSNVDCNCNHQCMLSIVMLIIIIA